MKTINKYILTAAVSSMSLGAMADINIDFESNEGFTAISMYDAMWEDSPFRTGVLTGNCAITDNPDTSVNEIIDMVPNPSAKVLGAQRSRFAGNRFGVRVDLAESFELTPTLKYVHVMIYRPTTGRMMLVGLGSRTERHDQDPYCEQFWALPSNSTDANRWTDVVFPVKGAGGIDVRSLVIVPDMESPHDLTEDFLFYVDNIEVSNSSTPRFIYEYYPVQGEKATSPMIRTDRVTSDLSLTIDGKTYTVPITQQSNKLLYQDLTDNVFNVKPGQTITPALGYTTKDWMHAYAYVDFNNDGQFSADIKSDGTPADGTELVSFNGYNGSGSWRNSKGQAINSNGNLTTGKCGLMPDFTLPADLKPGMYRMRLKLDWNCIDPMGNPGDANGNNLINSNGGVIADIMLNVYGDEVTVNDFQLNGEVLAGDGTKLNALKAPAAQPFPILMNPENGFIHDGVDIKIGYNLDGEKFDKYGNPQYTEIYIPGFRFTDNKYTIPADVMCGNILINGRMVEVGTPVSTAYPINFPETLTISRTDRRLNSLTLATSGDDSDVSISVTTKKVYQNFMDTEVAIMAGETMTPTVNYTGKSMHTYYYVDLDEDGAFSHSVTTNGTPTGEMLSYSHYNGRNSLGQSASSDIRPQDVNHPFTIPSTTLPGIYRCRFKIDWNWSDPGGRYSANGNNKIHENGGYVVDFAIHVHDTTAPITAETPATYGNILTKEDHVIAAEAFNAPYNQALAISGTTDNGSKIKKLNAKYGYNFDQAATVMGNTYWREMELEPSNDGSFTIPAEVMTRPVFLTGEFEQTGPSEIIEINAEKKNNTFYDLRGIRVEHPTRGLYIVDGKKVIVK